MKTMIMVGGGKGGVGKSTVAMAVLDALRQDGHAPVYVETDDSNPDVFKAVHSTVPCEICTLDTESGYVRLGDLMESKTDSPIVVNAPARATPDILEHGGILCDVANQTERRMVMVWPLNRQRDGPELVKQFVDAGQPLCGGLCAAEHILRHRGPIRAVPGIEAQGAGDRYGGLSGTQ